MEKIVIIYNNYFVNYNYHLLATVKHANYSVISGVQ